LFLDDSYQFVFLDRLISYKFMNF